VFFLRFKVFNTFFKFAIVIITKQKQKIKDLTIYKEFYIIKSFDLKNLDESEILTPLTWRLLELVSRHFAIKLTKNRNGNLKH